VFHSLIVHSLTGAGSEEETEDVLEAYRTSSGDLDGIMSRIPHSTTKDEARFITLIESSIESGSAERLVRWTKTSGSVKGKRRRAKVEAGEAKEAEEHAKVLGIWEEMYGDAQKAAGSGSGKGAEVKGKSGKRSRPGEPTSAGDEGEDDLSGLAAMIAKRQGSRESAMNALFEKYSRPPPVKRSKKK
jgi:DnaJ family protein C protein 9